MSNFSRAIDCHNHLIGIAGGYTDHDSWSVTFEDLASNARAVGPLRRSPFVNFGEGVLFRNLIERSLKNKHPKCVVDLGCGSGLPSLCAIQKLGLDTFWMGVDIDPEATDAADWNRAQLKVSGCVQRINLGDFLSSIYLPDNASVVANPPYIPTPPQAQNLPNFRPVAAGPDGLLWIRNILNWATGKSVNLSLVASSLTCPTALYELITNKFRIQSLSIHRVKFGPYLKQPVVSSFLEDLQSKDEVYFEVESDAKFFFTYCFEICQNE